MTGVIIAGLLTVFVMGTMYLGAEWFMKFRGGKSLDRRIDRLAGNLATDERGLLEGDENGFDLLPPEQKKNFFEGLMPDLPSFARWVDQADVKYKPSQILVASGGMGFAGVITPIALKLPYALVMAGTLGAVLAVLPVGYVWFARRGRLKKFEGQLGEAMELVARALRAGHSLASGMQVVSSEMPNPISKEFGRVYEEQNLGIPIEGALRNLADRVPNLDLKFFVTAVCIQRQTGGDLAEILDKIGYIIRERFKILGMVQALTGEGRLSGVILIAMPFVLLVAMMQMSPGYVDPLWMNPLGRQMSVGAIVLMILGAFWINKIVNIKI